MGTGSIVRTNLASFENFSTTLGRHTWEHEGGGGGGGRGAMERGIKRGDNNSPEVGSSLRI